MNKPAGPLDLRSTFVVVNKKFLADTNAVTNTIWNDGEA
jgi:hypothetical protein